MFNHSREVCRCYVVFKPFIIALDYMLKNLVTNSLVKRVVHETFCFELFCFFVSFGSSREHEDALVLYIRYETLKGCFNGQIQKN